MSYSARVEIDVSKHVEKKGKHSYLSWVFFFFFLQRLEEGATWEQGEHTVYPDGSMMVTTTVSAFGKTLPMWLPVMDHSNKAIKAPDAYAINKAYMRCLAKNIAAHGIGLHVYAKDDLPSADDNGDVATISDEQFETLDTLICTKGVKVEEFCTRFQISTVAALPASKFEDARKRLEARQ